MTDGARQRSSTAGSAKDAVAEKESGGGVALKKEIGLVSACGIIVGKCRTVVTPIWNKPATGWKGLPDIICNDTHSYPHILQPQSPLQACLSLGKYKVWVKLGIVWHKFGLLPVLHGHYDLWPKGFTEIRFHQSVGNREFFMSAWLFNTGSCALRHPQF